MGVVRVLREVVLKDQGVGVLQYDAYAMGARGVVWIPTDGANGRVSLFVEDAAVANQVLVAKPFVFAAADEGMGPLRFPVPLGVLRLQVVAGTVSCVLLFVDEPLEPVGQWILSAETRAVGAGATATPIPLDQYGYMRRLLVLGNSDQEFRYDVLGQFLGVTMGVVATASQTGASGGALGLTVERPPTRLQVDVVNLDGANAMTAQSAFIAELG